MPGPLRPASPRSERSRWATLIVGQASALLLSCSLGVGDSGHPTRYATSSRPAVPRQGENLVPDPSVRKKEKWSLSGGAEFDASTSRRRDGSGSVKLDRPNPNGSKVFSDYIRIQGGRKYTYGFYLKSRNGPTYATGQVGLHDRNKRFIRNLPSGGVGTTLDGEWEEFALPVFVPKEAVFVRVQVSKMENTMPGGQVWADDFYLGEGLGLEQSPSPKHGFPGQQVRVDSLGNFEVKRKGVWTPFFPLCIYADNHRDWSVYSRQGWNVNIWTSSAAQVKQARDAVSDFNPDGMLAGVALSRYTFPGVYYNQLGHLEKALDEIYREGLGDQILMFYWDNEVNHDQWQVPRDVIGLIKRLDVDASGRRLHPIYALQGAFNIARVHAARGLVDVSGTYVGGEADGTGDAGAKDSDGLLMLDRLQAQTTPAAIAQFNGVDGAGDMRLRLYNAILLGARGMGYWRDCFHAGCRKASPSVGPVDEKAWWPDFPALRREVDGLLPILREPHWTSWKVRASEPDEVRVGTRDHAGEGHLILVNQRSRQQEVTLALEDLSYAALEARDYFSGERVASIRDGRFSITLPGIGVGSGTRVLRLVAPEDGGAAGSPSSPERP